ncbi:transposase [Paucibacter oligotrophus]|uniref:Transposase n=1 Tax=Roseateles oligotrophus TaxID=1769250 RepID=A0A840LAD4_9BURK|nr:IS66 family transposase [Roseateles oligotrophus]MBB4843089.1 transposase [Roseateles oligotrophus]
MQGVPQVDGQVIDASTPAKPDTLAQCHAVIALLALEVEGLRLQLASQAQALAALQERLKLDSKNSSKPPSSDGPASPNRAQRRASGRKRGAQLGHKGSARAMLDEAEVDQIIDCAPAELCDCGAPVTVVAEEPIRHQVFDVPPVKAQVHEYRRYAGRCTGCGKAHRAALPAGVPSGQIGPRALALVGTLGTHYHLTQNKIRDLLARVLGVDFCVGAISQAHGKMAQTLKAPAAQIGQYVRQAPVKHMDETRYPREGAGNWAWAVLTPEAVCYSLLPSRARYVATSLVGESFTGILVSDRYAVYDYVNVHKRQVCWAHLLRDFTRIAQRDGLAGQIGRGLLGAGFVLFRWHTLGKTAAQFDPLRRRIKRLLVQGSGLTQCTRTANTCANLLTLWPALWTFIDNPAVPPTNNAAEQALRALVLKRKISGPTRSRRGDEFLAHGFSVYETCRRQGRDLWDYMHQAVVAWINKTTAPSLLPPGAVLAPSG